MKRFLVLLSMLAMVLVLSVPAMAAGVDDSGGSGEQPPTQPTGGEESPPEEVISPQEEVPTAAPELADTGIDAAVLAVAAVGLLLAGGVALVVARRAGRHG